MIALGNNIKKYRKDRKITQEQLAEVLGVSDQAVSRWENGATYPDIELLPTIALTHLEAAAKHAIACDTLPEEGSYTSTLLRGETFRPAENAKNYTQTERDILRNWMKRKQFDFIRNDERFKAVEGMMN